MSYQKSSTYSVRSSTSSRAPSGHMSITRTSAAPAYRSASIYGGAGGRGARISSSSYSGVHSGMGTGMGLGVGGGFSSSVQMSGSGESTNIMGNEKFAMQNLNDRLANYLETVRNLEQANGKLEIKIREALEKSGPDFRDYSKYQAILDDLRKKVFDATIDNARLVLQIDNARLAADDFRVKFESELSIRQSVEADIVGLRKVIDDTNMGRMNLESEIEALKEELIHLKKNHDNEVMELRNQISLSGVQVDVDAPKGQDLAQIMSEMRAKYEKMALKNQEELKTWHESQITEVQSQVTQNTEALKGAQTEVNDLRRQLQTLEIELESQRSLKASLEGTLRDTEMRYNMEMESLNTIILGLESELTQLRSSIQQQTQDYETLLNMKMKLEAEIATYRRLLDGGDFKLQDALEDQKTVKTKVMTVTQTLVDGKVVSSSTETKNLCAQVLHRSTSGSNPMSLLRDKSYAHSVTGGAGGHGTRISTASYGPRFGSFVGGYDYQSQDSRPGSFTIGNEKVTMQHLNDRLATYMEMVRNLEEANSKLEIKIMQVIENRGPCEERDYGKYNTIIMDLRSKIFHMIRDNAQLAIAVDNAHLASDDFKVKLEYEISMRQAVEADVVRLRKLLDDTNVVRLHLESDIESLKEELITLRKNHKADVAELRAQIMQAGVQVDIDAPKGQDLTKIMEEMRAKYEKIALKNQEELKAWHESQITEVEVQVTENTVALKEATSVVSETRRRYQTLEIELQSQLSLKASLEATLRDIDTRYNMEIEKYNEIIVRLQAELSQIRTDTQKQTREYELLLNIKMKLEAEIAEYRRLLDGEGEFKLEHALDVKKTVQTKVVTLTQTVVDGKVVSETKDVKATEKVVD
ncbi:keratin, type I cytoskeletal 18 [Polymixia lowei]